MALYKKDKHDGENESDGTKKMILSAQSDYKLSDEKYVCLFLGRLYRWSF